MRRVLNDHGFRVTRLSSALGAFIAVLACLLPVADASASSPLLSSPLAQVVPGETSVEGPEVTASSSRLDVRSTGDPEANRAVERRQFQHANLQPAGRYLNAGESFTVEVPHDARGLRLRLGLDGGYKTANEGVAEDPVYFDLEPGSQVIVAPQDGLIHLVDGAAEASRLTRVTVSGGIAVPTFIPGRTDLTDFATEIARSTVPLATLIGRNFTADIQTPIIDTFLEQGGDLPERIASVDRVLDISNRTWGLSREGSGVDRKSADRLRIISPDSGGGGYASAGNGVVVFQVDTGAAIDLLSVPAEEQWGLWHEVGHTYQPGIVNWSGMQEASVNVNSLAVQRELGVPNRLDDPGFLSQARNFLALPDEVRNFDDAGVWTKLLLLDQLTRAFGADFYARLAQEDRVDAILGVDLAGADAFARRAASVGGRDLAEFFDAWGFGLSNETAEYMSRLPKLRTRIWENFDSNILGTERLVTYTPPRAEIIATGQAVLGQRSTGAALSTRLIKDNESVAALGLPFVIATRTGTLAGTAAQRVIAENGTPNAVYTRIGVRHANDLELQGLGNGSAAVVSLDPVDGRFHVTQNSDDPIHSYFAGEYVTLTLRTASGDLKASASVAGTDSTQELRLAFDGIPWAEEDSLTIRHTEPSRLLRWDQGFFVENSNRSEQTFRIIRGRLVDPDVPTAPEPTSPNTSSPTLVESNDEGTALDPTPLGRGDSANPGAPHESGVDRSDLAATGIPAPIAMTVAGIIALNVGAALAWSKFLRRRASHQLFAKADNETSNSP